MTSILTFKDWFKQSNIVKGKTHIGTQSRQRDDLISVPLLSQNSQSVLKQHTTFTASKIEKER
jgi:hypothetical protein